MRGWRAAGAWFVVAGVVALGAGCARGKPRPGGPTTGGWIALLAPDVAIAPGAVVASEDFTTGQLTPICSPAEWLGTRDGEPLPDLDLAGALAPGEMRDELESYVKAHAKETKTPPLIDLDGRTVDRAERHFGTMNVLGYHQNTLHPWSRTGVKEGCLAAITSQEDGAMHEGSKWSVAVVTRVLLAHIERPAPAPVLADAGAAIDAGVPNVTATPPPPLERTRKGYLEGEGVVWAVQLEPLAPAK